MEPISGKLELTMHISVVRASEVTFDHAGETCLIAPTYEKDFPFNCEALGEEHELFLQALADKEVITGRAQELYFLPTFDGPYKGILVVGLGKRDHLSEELARRCAGKACPLFTQNRTSHVYLDVSHHPELPVAAFLEGLLLGQYHFDIYKAQKDGGPHKVKVESFTVIAHEDAELPAIQRSLDMAALLCLSANGARHLANTGSNEMTPTALAEFAEGIAKESGCESVILEKTQMAALGMNALLAVAGGSDQPPKLIILRHHHSDDAKTIAIVGKGVTFDSGGISIKPANAMHEMKFDMCGAAAVLCAMMNVVELKPAINVICVVPAVENMLNGQALRPGDIIKAYNGKTIEVHNTDAEGRLILADAMAFVADKYAPDMMVDLATLTGACVVALGHYAAAIFGTSEELLRSLAAAGDEAGELLWPMPLWEDYERLIEGTHADLCNIGPAGEAGAITAAAFLKQFVGDVPWCHIDIAGTAWGGKNIPYLDPNHASGYGVRLLTRWILKQAEAQ